MSTCSYCYSHGHNRRGCPSRKANLKQSADNGCEWSAAELNKKTTRRCGFCRQEGHDRRKCSEEKAALESITNLMYEADCVLAARLNRVGLVPGALLSYETYRSLGGEWGSHRTPALVTGIKWEYTEPDDLAYTRYRNSFLSILTTDGQAFHCAPPPHILHDSVELNRPSEEVVLLEPGTKHMMLPSREHASRKAKYKFTNKDFKLYAATQTKERYRRVLDEFCDYSDKHLP